MSRARRVVENAFGILASRFRVLHRPMTQNVENTIDIVHCCCVLHNLFRVQNPLPDTRLIDAEGPDHRLIPGTWHANAELVDTYQASMGVAGIVNAEAKNLRRELTEFYTTDWGSSVAIVNGGVNKYYPSKALFMAGLLA